MTVDPAAPAAVPDAAAVIFGARLELAVRYAELLASEGVLRGLIGPREAGRVWDRHVLNCAVIGEVIPAGSLVCDVGSGAGLPGVPLALARPDLRVELIEPMERRASFLRDVVAELDLGDTVTVLRARGEEGTRDRYDVVTARALAPLLKLVPMVLPLAHVGGLLVAMKGAGALVELSEAAPAITACGGGRGELVTAGVDVVEPPTTLVLVRRIRAAVTSRPTGAGPRG